MLNQHAFTDLRVSQKCWVKKKIQKQCVASPRVSDATWHLQQFLFRDVWWTNYFFFKDLDLANWSNHFKAVLFRVPGSHLRANLNPSTAGHLKCHGPKFVVEIHDFPYKIHRINQANLLVWPHIRIHVFLVNPFNDQNKTSPKTLAFFRMFTQTKQGENTSFDVNSFGHEKITTSDHTSRINLGSLRFTKGKHISWANLLQSPFEYPNSLLFLFLNKCKSLKKCDKPSILGGVSVYGPRFIQGCFGPGVFCSEP